MEESIGVYFCTANNSLGAGSPCEFHLKEHGECLGTASMIDFLASALQKRGCEKQAIKLINRELCVNRNLSFFV